MKMFNVIKIKDKYFNKIQESITIGETTKVYDYFITRPYNGTNCMIIKHKNWNKDTFVTFVKVKKNRYGAVAPIFVCDDFKSFLKTYYECEKTKSND